MNILIPECFDSDCIINRAIMCSSDEIAKGKCARCGWNPAVVKARRIVQRRNGWSQTVREVAARLEVVRAEYYSHRAEKEKKVLQSKRDYLYRERQKEIERERESDNGVDG